MSVADLFGMRVIESRFLPDHVVLLDNGETLYAWNTATGEVRSMPKADLLRPITNLWPARASDTTRAPSSPSGADPTNPKADVKEETP